MPKDNFDSSLHGEAEDLLCAQHISQSATRNLGEAITQNVPDFNSRACNSLASTSTCPQKGDIFSHDDPPLLLEDFFKANLHDNITNEEGRLDTLLLVQSPANLGTAPLLRTWKRQHSDATFAFQIIFEYLKKSKGCNYSLCHVLNCHVDVDPKHVVCDEANEDKNGNMNPPLESNAMW